MVSTHVQQVRAALQAAARPDDAEPMARYMKEQFPFLGVRAAARRLACRSLIGTWLKESGRKPDWELVAELWDTPEREFQYVACDYLVRSRLDGDDLPRLKDLVASRPWWDTVDSLAKKIGSIATADDMRSWVDSGSLWVRRVALLHQLSRKEETDAALLSELILHVIAPGQPHRQDFFIRKAVGWALRDYARTNPQWVRDFVASPPQKELLSPLSVREATKHL